MTPEQFLLFADPLPEPTLLLSSDGLILAGNRAVHERLGICVSELRTKRLAEVVSESPDEVAHYLRLCCRSRSLVLGGMNLRRNNGNGIACRMEGTVVRPKVDGAAAILMIRVLPKEAATTQFVALNQRIEELGVEVQRRQRAEEEARQREEWLRVTLHSIGDGVICTDAQGRVTIMNPVAELLTGWRQDEAQAQPLNSVFVIVNEQTWQPVENPVEKVLREGIIVGLANHTVLIARDGTQRPIDDSAAPIRDKSGAVIGVALIFRDVTEQRQAEQELRSSEARKRAIFDTALDCIVTMDREGNVVEFNPAAEKTFGYRRKQVIGRQLADFIIPTSLRERYQKSMMHYFATGEGPILGKRIEFFALHSDGTEFPVELAITRILTDGPPMFTAYFRDITDRKRAEQHRNVRLAVTHVLSVASGPDESTSGVLRAVCENLGWDVGFFWTVNQAETALVCRTCWHRSDLTVTDFEAASFSRTFEQGVGLPGQVWSTGRSRWLLDVAKDTDFARAATAATYDLHSALACPVTVSGQTIGVIEFFMKRIREPHADLLEIMETFAATFGQFLERQLAEDQIRQSERELADFFDNATVGLHWVGPDGRILKANRAELDMLGYSPEEYIGRSITDFHADKQAICDILDRLQKGQQLHEYPARLLCKDGSIKDVLIDSSVLFTASGFVHTRCFTRDVTDRKRGDMLLAAQKQVLELLVQGAPLPDVLDALCQAIEEQSHDTLIATVLLIDEDGQRLRSVAGHRAPAEYALAVDGVVIGPCGGSCGTAAYRGEQVVVSDIATDPLWANFRELALGHGLRACWSTPIFSSEGWVLGTFAVYAQTPRSPTADELRTVDILTRTAGVAIERRRAEQELRFQARLLDTVDQAAIVTDANGMVIYWNRFAETLYGWPREDVLGQNIFDFVVSPDARIHASRIMSCLLAGETWSGEFQVKRRDGTTFVAFVTDTPLLDEQGNVKAIIGISVDITNRKRLENSLQLLANASATLADVVDYESTLQKVAALSVPRFSDWCAVDIAEPGGTLRRLAVAHVDETKVRLAQELDERYPPQRDVAYGAYHVLCTGRPEMMAELPDSVLVEVAADENHLRILRELGLKSYMCLPLIARGKTLGVITFVAAESGYSYTEGDLAFAEELSRRAAISIENARLYRELQDAARRKDEFLATLAHELRNPLAPIRNGLQVMRLSGSENGIVTEARSMMERQLNQMIRLVDDLLDVSRITRDKLELKKQRVELEALLLSAVETSRPLIEQAGHTISVTPPSTRVFLDADMTRLAQVFSNLLNNSAKYTPSGGHIWLVAEAFENEVAVKVRDNGLGIPAESLPRIFQMFSQVDRNMEMAQGGLGIGLTLVRRLVEMHGGTVEAYSDGPGQGSEFTVRLPILKTAHAVLQASTTANGLMAKRRILIVDDNHDAAMTMGMMLKLMGNDIHTVHDGLAAVEAAEQFRPDMILLDIGLPKLNGYDVCRRIRTQPWSVGMEIIALTGWGQEDDRRRSKEAGFDHHLVKPVEVAGLEKLLASPAARSASPEQSTPARASLRVLVVDDMRDATHMLRVLLTRDGHVVQTASDGPSALAAAINFRPEVVLLDISLPGMSGLEVAKRIRQQSTLKDIVLIAMTGYGDDADRRRSMEAGFDHHLVKPADITIVQEILATVSMKSELPSL